MVPEGYKKLAKIGISYKGEYVAGTTYSQLDAVYYQGSTYIAVIDGPVGAPSSDGINWRYLAQGAGEDISDSIVAFEAATTRENIISGEKQNTIMGKIKKFFSDLTAAAFAQMIASYDDLMANTVSGYLPDAQAVKEGFETVNSSLQLTYEVLVSGLIIRRQGRERILHLEGVTAGALKEFQLSSTDCPSIAPARGFLYINVNDTRYLGMAVALTNGVINTVMLDTYPDSSIGEAPSTALLYGEVRWFTA